MLTGNVWRCGCYDLERRQGEIHPLVFVRLAVCQTNPLFDRVIPPCGSQGMLVYEHATDALDEGLDFPFNGILMLMARRGWLDGDGMLITKMLDRRAIVFGRPSVASNCSNCVTMKFVEANDFGGGTCKTVA